MYPPVAQIAKKEPSLRKSSFALFLKRFALVYEFEIERNVYPKLYGLPSLNGGSKSQLG